VGLPVRRLVVAATSVEQAAEHAIGRLTDAVASEIVGVTELGPRLYEVLVGHCPLPLSGPRAAV
jgi:hypothetical protein